MPSQVCQWRLSSRHKLATRFQAKAPMGHVWTAPWQELSDLMQHSRVRSRVRPVDAARMAAGPNAVRG